MTIATFRYSCYESPFFALVAAYIFSVFKGSLNRVMRQAFGLD